MAIKRRIVRQFYKIKKVKKFFNKIKIAPAEIIKYKTLKKLHNNIKKLGLRAKKQHAINAALIFFNQLSDTEKQNELKYARYDVRVFSKHVRTTLKKDLDKNFNPYLPNTVWQKMSRKQKTAHLKKRDKLKALGVKFIKQKYKHPTKIYKAYFTKIENRPLLKAMNTQTRAAYLQHLIKMTKKFSGVKQITKIKALSIFPWQNDWEDEEKQAVSYWRASNKKMKETRAFINMFPKKPRRKKNV